MSEAEGERREKVGPAVPHRPEPGLSDTVTAGGDHVTLARPPSNPDRYSPEVGAGDPNGWFAGPRSDPDRFQLIGPGLAGGEGNIWRARYRGELTSPLTVAVKELRRPRNAEPSWPTAADIRRWEDQRALLQYMRIDHLVTMIDIFVGPPPHLPGPAPEGAAQRDTPYVVMEWVPGRTLADELSGQPVRSDTLDGRLAHVQHVAEALHALHSQTASAGNPTLHRDVKPTNCILDPRRGVVLVDVGTMRRMDDGYDDDGLHTPAYTAPEVLVRPRAAREVASDLYSLGALAYFCVLGEDPPAHADAGQVQARLLEGARAAGVLDVEGFVGQLRLMLDPVPAQRPTDAMAWARRLRALGTTRRGGRLRGRGEPADRGVLLLGGLLVVALVGFSAVQTVKLMEDDDPLPVAARPVTGGGPAPPTWTPGAPPPSPPPGLPPGPPPSGMAMMPPPAAGAPPPGARPGPEGNITSDIAAITSPANGAVTPRCTTVRGTSALAAGLTLVLSVDSLDGNDRTRHLQLVPRWERPASLRHWQGAQFVGRPEDPAGGRFRIEVLAVPLAALRSQLGGLPEAGRRGWADTVPPGSVVAASVLVTKAAGPGGACPPPPSERP